MRNTADIEINNINHFRVGFYVSLMVAITTIITFGIAIMTPPLSGPFCESGCFEYPYKEIISRFPRDYYWMYPAMLISVLFVMLFVSIHYFADYRKKIYSHIGLAFSILSAAFLIPNYFIQVSVIQPSLLNGETEGIALITQFNPHGVFIALEEIGFLFMCFAFFTIIPVFNFNIRIERAIQSIYFVGFAAGLIALIFISAKFGLKRAYLFEVVIISIVWLELIISSILLSIVFRRVLKKQ